MGYVIHHTCQIPTLEKIYIDVFGDNHIGSFVEVGAFDGMWYSNTWGLANAGWDGIYIEAHPDFAKQCQWIHRDNPKIKVESCACGATETEKELIIFGECSTTVLDKWAREWKMNEDTPKIKVPCYQLETLLYLHKIQKFDLLVVDVEGTEIEVLKGFNINAHIPKMVIVELHEGQGTESTQKGWQTPWVDNYMKRYKKIYADAINTIYVFTE